MKLMICSAQHGHLTLEEPKAIKDKFEEILTKGFGGKKHIPPTFFIKREGDKLPIKENVSKQDIDKIVNDTSVQEVVVTSPVVGG